MGDAGGQAETGGISGGGSAGTGVAGTTAGIADSSGGTGSGGIAGSSGGAGSGGTAGSGGGEGGDAGTPTGGVGATGGDAGEGGSENDGADCPPTIPWLDPECEESGLACTYTAAGGCLCTERGNSCIEVDRDCAGAGFPTPTDANMRCTCNGFSFTCTF